MAQLAKWKVAYLEQVKTMSNEELFDEYNQNAWPDDYDNCFTPEGDWRSTVTHEEFTKRLKEIGFLK